MTNTELDEALDKCGDKDEWYSLGIDTCLLEAARELSQLRKGEHPDFVMVPMDIINSIKIQSDFFSQDGININLAVMTLKQISLACESITAQKVETK